MKRVTLIHIGDTHRSPGVRVDDKDSALSQIYEYAFHHKPVAFLWPGDLFHKESTPEDRNAMTKHLQWFAAIAPVVIVRGNHDWPGDLDIFSSIQTHYGVHVVDRPGVIGISGPEGESISIYCLPYPERAGLVTAGVAKGDVATTAAEVLDTMCIHASNELAMESARGYITCVAAHVNVVGSIASTGQPQIGREVEISRESLERFPEQTYIALNHIHKHQQIGRGVYAGSICRMDFGENDPKGFVEVVFTIGDVGVWEHTWRFVELVVPKQIRFTGVLSPDGFQVESIDGDEQGAQPDCTGADVRVDYTYLKSDAGMLKESTITKAGWLRGARSVKCSGHPIVVTELRAPTVTAQPDLPSKVRAWVALDGAEWSPALDEKLGALLTEVAL